MAVVPPGTLLRKKAAVTDLSTLLVMEMKIVFIAPFGLRPKGTVTARMIPLAAGLNRLGHDVVVVAPPYTNPEDSGRVETVRGVTVRNIVLGPANRALAAPLLAWRLFRAVMAEKPNLVHLFKPKGYGGLAVMLMVCCGRLGIRMPRLFLDCDDWEGRGGMNELHDYSLPERYLYSFQEKWLSSRMQGLTVASRMLAESFRETAPGLKLLYLPNCVEDRPPGDGRSVRRRLGIPDDAPVLLLYTRFFEFSQDRLHHLFAELYRRLPGLRLLVVGTGRKGEEKLLEDFAAEKGFRDALLMAGWIEPAEIPDYLAAGDVAVYPFADTLVNRAKCPAKLTELLRAGLPVVADRVGQIPEYFAPELHRLLCEPDSWDEMATKCEELLLDASKRRWSSSLGREFILGNYSWKDHVELLHGFYLKHANVNKAP